ncbi:MAG: hypothetical protein JJV88_03505 [Sulfurovum sp.]|nr:hypothetical protein [Sulfurovaceae bacterium]
MNKIIYIILLSTFLISQTIKGGEVAEGLDLADIKMAKHIDYTRVVFYVNWWEGHTKPNTPADTTGSYTFVLSDDNKSIEVELSGFRSATVKDIKLVDTIKSIEELKGEKYADDSSIFYKINLTDKASEIKAFTLKSPARIILDIYQKIQN